MWKSASPSGGSGDSTIIWGMLESWREQIRTKLFPSFLFLLRDFENLYKFLMDVNLSKITRITGCQKPCTYKEYRFMNTIPRDYNFYTFLQNQNAFFLWSVSQNTQMEIEFLVYSFDSLGVSFMTIWDFVVGQWLIRNMWTFKSLFVLLYRVTSAAICFEDMSELLSPIHRTLQ